MTVFKNTEKMFDKIAANYDFMNNLISLFTHKTVKRKVLSYLNFKKNSIVLDLCCGTGDLAGIIKKKCPEINVAGADNSEKMLEIAKRKYPNIPFFKEDAQNLGFKDKSFDFVVMGFGLRNVLDKSAAVKEIYRILKKEGIFLHLDITKKSPLDKIFNAIVFIFSLFLKNKNAYSYLIKSKNEFMDQDEIAWFFENFGFEVVLNKKLFLGLITFQIAAKY